MCVGGDGDGDGDGVINFNVGVLQKQERLKAPYNWGSHCVGLGCLRGGRRDGECCSRVGVCVRGGGVTAAAVRVGVVVCVCVWGG